MLTRVLKNNERKRDHKVKIPTRVGTTGSTSFRWRRTLPQRSANTEERLQRGQTIKNCRTELEMELNKASMANKAQDLTTMKQIIRGMAETCTKPLHAREGRVGNVAVGIGGTLVSPPLSVDQDKGYFGDAKNVSKK